MQEGSCLMIGFPLPLKTSEDILRTFIINFWMSLKNLTVWGIRFLFYYFALKFHWTETIQVPAHQYGEVLTDEKVDTKDCSKKVNYLKRNPVTVARQIDYVFMYFEVKLLKMECNLFVKL